MGAKTVAMATFSGEGLYLGQQHGEHFRSKIQEFVNTFTELNALNTAVAVNQIALKDLCRRNLYFLERYSPCLSQEMEGIAQGANVNFYDILMLNCFLELNDIQVPQVANRLLDARNWGCTTFNVKPRSAKNGRPILGQTYDMEAYFAQFNILMKIKNTDGRSKLIYSLAGVLGLNGFNDLGIAVVINKLVPTDSRPGVIYPMLIRQALDQDLIGDALAAVAFAPRASGLCYQLTCPEGIAFCLETTAKAQQELPFRFAKAHTNHYLSPQLQSLEADWLDQGGSYVRLQVAQDILKDSQGKITPELLKELCRNHINDPRSICAHSFPVEPSHKAMATISAVVIEPSDLTMHFAGIYPCSQEFTKFKL
jgi:isopenicillin-N N-acyltransferase-like protein